MFIKILWLLFGHYLLDYPLQGDFLATTKGKLFSSLFAHSMIYASGMSLIIYYNNIKLYRGNENILLVSIILFTTHIFIDNLKASSTNIKRQSLYLFLDQTAHIIINVFLFFLF